MSDRTRRTRLICILEDYMSDLKITKRYGRMYGMAFYQSSYVRWAVNEFYFYVNTAPIDIRPLTLAETFRDQMVNYACMGKNNIMFSVASDTMEDIIDLISCSCWKEKCDEQI